MATKLRKLKIDRVDLVDKGANQESHILLFKRDDERDDEPDDETVVKVAMTLQDVLDKQEAEEEKQEMCWKATDALMESLRSVADMDNDTDRLQIIVTSAKQYIDLMRPIHQSLQEEDVHMSDKPNEELDAMKAEMASLKSANDALTKQLSETEAELAKRDEKHVEEDIWKSVPPALKRMFEEQKRETEIAKAAAQVERDERIRRDCIQKAEAYEYLPVNPTSDWVVFKAIDDLDSNISDRIYELFSSGDSNLNKSGLTNERGSRGGKGESMSPYEEIQQLVSNRMSKSDKSLTYDEALDSVLRDRPDLYKSYVDGTMVQIGKGD